MSSGVLVLHAVGVALKVLFPTTEDYSTATVSLRLRKPDGSDIDVPAEPVQTGYPYATYKTRKGDINRYGTYTLYGTATISGVVRSIEPGSFRAEKINAPGSQSGVG